jgi:alpha-galactosidase
LWNLLAAPLFFGGDMTKLDDFTLGLLTNDEVIEVNQDVLGKQGRRVWKDGTSEVWAKPLEGGALAVGLFNRGEGEVRIAASWSTLGVQGKRRVRDLWRQKNLGAFEGKFETVVGRHGVVLVRVR